MIYLDNAATSFPKPEAVYQTLDRFARQDLANPGRAGHKMADRVCWRQRAECYGHARGKSPSRHDEQGGRGPEVQPRGGGRLRDLGIESYKLGRLTKLIVSQELIRKLCPHCKEPDPDAPFIAERLVEVVFPDREDLKEAIKAEAGGALPDELK